MNVGRLRTCITCDVLTAITASQSTNAGLCVTTISDLRVICSVFLMSYVTNRGNRPHTDPRPYLSARGAIWRVRLYMTMSSRLRLSCRMRHRFMTILHGNVLPFARIWGNMPSCVLYAMSCINMSSLRSLIRCPWTLIISSR